jgi:hypothetical protein
MARVPGTGICGTTEEEKKKPRDTQLTRPLGRAFGTLPPSADSLAPPPPSTGNMRLMPHRSGSEFLVDLIVPKARWTGSRMDRIKDGLDQGASSSALISKLAPLHTSGQSYKNDDAMITDLKRDIHKQPRTCSRTHSSALKKSW